MTYLPTSFSFSQSSLSDYQTCPRRFALRYLRQLTFPDVALSPPEEAERRLNLGQDFHRLVQQDCLGLDATRLQAMADAAADPELAQLWHNYRRHRPPALNDPAARLMPEVTLATSLGAHRLLARFDLLVWQPGQVVIFDWKTSPSRPEPNRLAAQWQSRLYPFVLVEAGAAFNKGQAIDPAMVQLNYWFAHHPAAPITFSYSAAQHDETRTALQALIAEIESRREFPLTSDERACRFCAYRSYCGRTVRAADVEELEDDLEAAEEEISTASL